MRDVLGMIQTWRAEKKGIALATVVEAKGSTPRREGARLVISSHGEMAGSVSGGCVENDVVGRAINTSFTNRIDDALPGRLSHKDVAITQMR